MVSVQTHSMCHLSNMRLLFCLLLPVVYGLSSSDFQEYQIKAIKPKWISLTEDAGLRNVTVDYDHDSLVHDVQCFWWVNGKLITDGDYNFRVNNFQSWRRFVNMGVYQHGENAIDEYVKRTSILIPPSFSVHSLQLQIVSDALDIIIDINVIPIAPGKSIREYIPEYEMEMEPKNDIVYDRGDSLNFVIYFTAKNLERLTFDEVKAEFISMELTASPPKAKVETSESHRSFFNIRPANYEDDRDDISYNRLMYLDDPSHKLRRLNVTYNSDDLPRGILKVMTGYSSRSSCLLFAGARVIRSAFLKPPPHEHGVFFPENSVALLGNQSNYSVEYGGNVDVSVTAIGGKLKPSDIWDEDLVLESPEVYLVKSGQNVTAMADVKRLLQTEAHFRFRNVNATHSGKYMATGRVGSGRANLEFNIFVRNVPPAFEL